MEFHKSRLWNILSLISITNSFHETHALPSGKGQTKTINQLHNDQLYNTLSYLSRNEIDALLVASPDTEHLARQLLHYDRQQSVLGDENVFVSVYGIQLPPPDIGLFHIYVCDDALTAIEARKPSVYLSHLLTLHVMFCTGNRLPNLSITMMDTFVALKRRYTTVTDLKVFGPEGTPLTRHVYDYLHEHPEDQIQLARMLATGKFDINQPYSRGDDNLTITWCMIHEASTHGHVEIVRQLIALGADISVQDNRGRTPLDYALENEYAEIAAMLQPDEDS